MHLAPLVWIVDFSLLAHVKVEDRMVNHNDNGPVSWVQQAMLFIKDNSPVHQGHRTRAFLVNNSLIILVLVQKVRASNSGAAYVFEFFAQLLSASDVRKFDPFILFWYRKIKFRHRPLCSALLWCVEHLRYIVRGSSPRSICWWIFARHNQLTLRL